MYGLWCRLIRMKRCTRIITRFLYTKNIWLQVRYRKIFVWFVLNQLYIIVSFSRSILSMMHLDTIDSNYRGYLPILLFSTALCDTLLTLEFTLYCTSCTKNLVQAKHPTFREKIIRKLSIFQTVSNPIILTRRPKSNLTWVTRLIRDMYTMNRLSKLFQILFIIQQLDSEYTTINKQKLSAFNDKVRLS